MRYKIKEKWDKTPLEVKVSLSYAMCSVFQQCISFITLPLFARLLSTEQYGQVTVYNSWLSLLTIFITLQLPYGSFNRAMIKYETRRDEYIASAQSICLCLTILFLVIYLPFCSLWNLLFELPTAIMIVMVFQILASSGLAFWSGKKRFEYRYKEVIAITLVSSVLSPFIQYCLVINFKEKGYARILGCALVYVLFGGIIFIVSLIKGKRLFNKEFWQYALGFNVPLLIYYLSQVIFNTSDRIMISHMEGKGKAAIYGVAYNLAVMLNFVLTSINNSYVPWFYEKLKTKKQDENKSVACSIAIILAGLLLLVIWFAPEIIQILAGDKYAEAVWIVPPVAMSVLLLFYSQLCINFEFYFEQKKLLVNASICSAVVNVILNALLIPIFGYFAAGYTTLFSYFIFVGFNYYAMKRIMAEKEIHSHGLDVKGLLIILGIFIIAGFCGMSLYTKFLIRLGIAFIAMVFVLINHTKILDIIKTIKKGK